MIILVGLARLVMYLVHFTADQVILIGHDLEAVVAMCSHHTRAELLHEGVHINMDIVTVGSRCGEISQGSSALSVEAAKLYLLK
jgi:hypothetical protein